MQIIQRFRITHALPSPAISNLQLNYQVTMYVNSDIETSIVMSDGLHERNSHKQRLFKCHKCSSQLSREIRAEKHFGVCESRAVYRNIHAKYDMQRRIREAEEASQRCTQPYRFQRYLPYPQYTCSRDSFEVSLLSRCPLVLAPLHHHPSRHRPSRHPSSPSFSLLPALFRYNPRSRDAKQIAKYPQVVDFVDCVRGQQTAAICVKSIHKSIYSENRV